MIRVPGTFLRNTSIVPAECSAFRYLFPCGTRNAPQTVTERVAPRVTASSRDRSVPAERSRNAPPEHLSTTPTHYGRNTQ